MRRRQQRSEAQLRAASARAWRTTGLRPQRPRARMPPSSTLQTCCAAAAPVLSRRAWVSLCLMQTVRCASLNICIREGVCAAAGETRGFSIKGVVFV